MRIRLKSEKLDTQVTVLKSRGHSFNLCASSFRKKTFEFVYLPRVAPVWNPLPEHIVTDSPDSPVTCTVFNWSIYLRMPIQNCCYTIVRNTFLVFLPKHYWKMNFNFFFAYFINRAIVESFQKLISGHDLGMHDLSIFFTLLWLIYNRSHSCFQLQFHFFYNQWTK